MPTTMIHGQRGRAGGESRLPPACTPAGPASAPRMIGGFTVLIRRGKQPAVRCRRAAEVVEHIEASGLVVVGEDVTYDQVMLRLAAWPLVTLAEAERIVATCPWVMPGSLEVRE